MTRNVDTLLGHVLGAENRGTSFDSAYIDWIRGKMRLHRWFRIPEPQFGMGLPIVAEEVEGV